MLAFFFCVSKDFLKQRVFIICFIQIKIVKNFRDRCFRHFALFLPFNCFATLEVKFIFLDDHGVILDLNLFVQINKLLQRVYTNFKVFVNVSEAILIRLWLLETCLNNTVKGEADGLDRGICYAVSLVRVEVS